MDRHLGPLPWHRITYSSPLLSLHPCCMRSSRSCFMQPAAQTLSPPDNLPTPRTGINRSLAASSTSSWCTRGLYGSHPQRQSRTKRHCRAHPHRKGTPDLGPTSSLSQYCLYHRRSHPVPQMWRNAFCVHPKTGWSQFFVSFSKSSPRRSLCYQFVLMKVLWHSTTVSHGKKVGKTQS